MPRIRLSFHCSGFSLLYLVQRDAAGTNPLTVPFMLLLRGSFSFTTPTLKLYALSTLDILKNNHEPSFIAY